MRKSLTLAPAFALVMAAGLLSGCAGTSGRVSESGAPENPRPEARSGKEEISLTPYLKEVAAQSSSNHEYADAANYWQAIYESDPTNMDVAFKFANNLRLAGDPRGAITLLGKVLNARPDDPEVLGERGKAYAADNQFALALADIDKALQKAGQSWSLHSSRGIILDRLDRGLDAEAAYKQALTISPGNPKILNNMALGVALAGRHDEAVALLRQAAQHPQATAQIRQNLSMLLAMKGDISEVEQLVRADLPRAMSENNMAFYRSLTPTP